MADKGLPASSIFSNGSFFFARGLNPPPRGGVVKTDNDPSLLPAQRSRPSRGPCLSSPSANPSPGPSGPGAAASNRSPLRCLFAIDRIARSQSLTHFKCRGGGIGGAKFGCENFYTRKTCQMLPPFLKDLYQIFPHPNFPRPNCLIHIFFTGRYLIEK